MDEGAVQATIRYVVRGEKSVFYPADRTRSYWPEEDHEMPIHDMRPIAQELAFDRNGFVLLNQPSALPDLADRAAVERDYPAEVEALIARLTGVERVISFGMMMRTDDPAADDGRQPAFGAHVDYGSRTVAQFTRDLLPPDEAERRLRGRHMLINVWRPIRPVERTPLALCDASTVRAEDLFESEVRGGLGDAGRRSLFGFNLAYRPEQRWYYAPHMQPEELFAFKLYDSDLARVQLTAHTAFNDPTSLADARPRHSIEIRTIAFMPENS